jgi:hypothetical protein
MLRIAGVKLSFVYSSVSRLMVINYSSLNMYPSYQ